MKNSLKWILGVLVLVLVIVGASFLYNYLSKNYSPDRLANENTDEEHIKDYTAPDFTVFDGDGKEVKLSDKKGKPVVVNFWASWCPPCKAELPDFDDMYKKYGDDVEFMIVNMTDGNKETLEKAKAYLGENDYSFPVYYDTLMSAAYVYGVNSIPMTLFIDSDGNFVTYAKGIINALALEKGIGMIK